MRLAVVIASVLAVAAPAAAQPIVCAICVRGDVVIDRYGMQSIRPIAAELAATVLAEPVTEAQYASLVALRTRTPALLKLAALDDSDLDAVAASLCRAPSDTCTTATSRTLRCLADRCAVALPAPDPKTADVVSTPDSCHQFSTRRRPGALGLGFDWGVGTQTSKHPTDGGAWSLGIETRLRTSTRYGVVARIDRVAGRDEATDANGNGQDDLATGSITRISALAGPSIVLGLSRFESSARFLRIDLLGGYLATQSQPDENGAAAGVDVAYQLWAVRVGARYVHGFGDAQDASMLLVHLGFLAGSSPHTRKEDDCGAGLSAERSRLAFGFDFPLGGYAFESLGYIGTGIGFETVAHLSPMFDVLGRVDLTLFTGGDRARVIHSAVLGGLRIDHGKRKWGSRVGFFSTWLVGYDHEAGLTPSDTDSGPISDLSLGWGVQGREGAAYLRLHGRFGISPDNVDYRAVFISTGFELRLDPSSWRDRR